MAQPREHNSQRMSRLSDDAVLEMLGFDLGRLIDALRADVQYEREPSGYTEGKAQEFDKMYAEAERRGLK